MRIPLTEPVSPRYIHINPKTNKVHLMVSIVGGQEISTDNTCRATMELKNFFEGGALKELNDYKNALEFDIHLLEKGNSQRSTKETRLTQIDTYIKAVAAMRYTYSAAITGLMSKPSNLYGIQLRPHKQDSFSKVEHPAFSIERKNDIKGNALSPLYKEMEAQFLKVPLGKPDPRSALITTVLAALPHSPDFATLGSVLGEHCKNRFGLIIDFKKSASGTEVDKEAIHMLMGFDEDPPPTTDMYLDALLGICAPKMWVMIPTPPFYNIPKETSHKKRRAHLSILTQFFLAHLNIYCKARGLTTQNFGADLDKSPSLSKELVTVVTDALSAGHEVEEHMLTFFNKHLKEFGLVRSLKEEDRLAITQKFERTYRTATVNSKENLHMDDFLILDKEATREAAKFFTHQGCICVNFAEVVDAVLPNQEYFAAIRTDFLGHPVEIAHKNEWVAQELDIDIEALLGKIKVEQFDKLPEAFKKACHTHPAFVFRHFLHDVAQGKQLAAEALLLATPSTRQYLLSSAGVFSDYSSRTFNCTAYEYAYWAKDTHMCRMLQSYMDEKTKALLLARINEMERNNTLTGREVGLAYQQHGKPFRTNHFDLNPLKCALQKYVDGYEGWKETADWVAMDNAWIVVGKAQREVPIHVAQEYCRKDRCFYPLPEFNEPTLPRECTFYNFNRGSEDTWFPLLTSDSGLGFSFAVGRVTPHSVWNGPFAGA